MMYDYQERERSERLLFSNIGLPASGISFFLYDNSRHERLILRSGGIASPCGEPEHCSMAMLPFPSSVLLGWPVGLLTIYHRVSCRIMCRYSSWSGVALTLTWACVSLLYSIPPSSPSKKTNTVSDFTNQSHVFKPFLLSFTGIAGPRSGWVNKLRHSVLTISFLTCRRNDC